MISAWPREKSEQLCILTKRQTFQSLDLLRWSGCSSWHCSSLQSNDDIQLSARSMLTFLLGVVHDKYHIAFPQSQGLTAS